MTLSTFYVYSIISNLNDYVKKGKNCLIFTNVHVNRYKNANPGVIKHCKRIYNDLENHYYTEVDLAIAVLHKHIMDGMCYIPTLRAKTILNIKKVYSINQLKIDEKVLKDVYKSMEFNDPCKFFEIHEDGTNLVYTLTKKGIISPTFSVKYLRKLLTNKDENVILCNEYKTFVHVVTKIEQILKRRSR